MRLSGVDQVELDREECWRRLTDLDILAAALPAVQVADAAGGNRLRASFRPLTGLGVTPMTVDFEVTESAEPERFALVGRGSGTEYELRLLASFGLAEEGGQTVVSWTLEIQMHGVIRSLTQRALPDIARQQVAAVLASVQAAAPRPGSR